MKLITLNIWGGHVEKPLLNFIISHQNMGIFCFQEVYHKAPSRVSTDELFVNLNIFSELQELLPNHNGFFRPAVNGIYGLGMFVHKDIEVLSEGDINIHYSSNYPGRVPTHSRNLQWVECCIDNKVYSIMNVHGLWNGMGKSDTPERVTQSEKIRDFMHTINMPKILCGDFNLRPDTNSIKILEGSGMQNLIDIYGIKSTRTSLYGKPEKFADYIFTSPDIKINNFEVMADQVSDHAPLLLDFD